MLKELSSAKECKGCGYLLSRTEENFVLIKDRHWSSRCHECLSLYNRKYHQLNKDHKRKVSQAYNKTGLGAYTRYKSGAKVRGISFTLSYDEFMTFWQKPCFYGGCVIETIGLDRVNNNVGYILKNIVPCCETHNLMKSDMTQEQFFKYCEQVVLKLLKGK